MSVWTEVNGSMLVHRGTHFSVLTALREHFEGYEANIRSEQTRIGENLVRTDFEFSYSMDGDEAYNVWKKFVDFVEDRIKKPDALDAVVSIRWLL